MNQAPRQGIRPPQQQQQRPLTPILPHNVPGNVPPRPMLQAQARPSQRPVGVNPRQPPPLAPKPQNLTPMRRGPAPSLPSNVATPPRPRVPGPAGPVPHVGTPIPQMRPQTMVPNPRFSTPQPYRSSIPMRWELIWTILLIISIAPILY